MYYMKRNYNIILFAFFYLVCIGYTDASFLILRKDSCPEFPYSYYRELDFKSNSLLDSRGIANKSIYDYFMGKYFTKEDINLLNRNLKSTSILGQDFITDLVYKREDYFLNDIHYGFRSHFDGSIGKDLAGLASKGNAPYAGKNLDNTNLLFRSISWHKIGVSFCYFNRKQQEPILTTSINYVSGNNYTYINLSNTQIFTQQNGDYIDSRWNADYRSSTTNKVLGFGGNGASIDLKYSKYFFNRGAGKQGVLLDAQITDLGFISWNKNNKNLSWDSSLRFSGLDVGNITTIASENYTDNLSDSLKTLLNSHYNYLKNNSILPAIFVLKISKIYTNGKTFNNSYVKLDYMMQASYKPQLTLGVESTKGKHALTPQIRFGGYGDFNIDLFYNYYIKKNTKQKWYFSVKLYSIEAIIAPKYQSGLGLGIQTNYKF